MKNPRTVALSIVVLCCLAFSALVAGSFYRQERRETLAAFTAEVDALANRFDQKLARHFEALYLLEALFHGSTQVTDKEFQRVARETLARHRNILALGWAPLEGSGETVPTLPLHYFVTKFASEDLLGVDLDSRPAVHQTLQATQHPGRLRATARLPLFKDPNLPKGVLVLLPLYDVDGQNQTASVLRGFLLGYYPLSDMLARLLKHSPLQDVRLTLMDHSAPPSQRLLYSQGDKYDSDSLPTYEKALPPLAGRQLTLQAQPSARYLESHGSTLPQLIMIAGFLVTLLLTAYLRTLLARSAQIERLVEARTRKLHEANDKLANLSMTDGLTGIANRRNFDSHLEVEWKRGIREQQPLTLMLIDIDCFKAYNDHYGHLQGDRCLRRVAQVLDQQTSRPGDLAARYGGEEFALILPHTDSAAATLGEQCRAAVEDLALPHVASSIATSVTVSIGIASLVPQRNSQPTEIIALADQALYQTKRSGRNRVMLASPSMEMSSVPGF